MKTRHRKTASPNRSRAPKAARSRTPSAADQQSEVAALRRELSEAREQQTAASEVLQIIAKSPGDLEHVFQAMLAKAVRICEAQFGGLFLCEGHVFRLVAQQIRPARVAETLRQESVIDLRDHHPRLALARVARTKELVHIPDLRTDEAYLDRDPRMLALVDSGGARTLVTVPMLKEGDLVGTIALYRRKVSPFTEKQIEIVQNFAAQAVIAIENTRLLNELRQRTTDLTDSLEQQTATSEVLSVISSSPGDLQPVFESMLANATRLCEANFGTLNLHENGAIRVAAMHNAPVAFAELRHREPVFRPNPLMPLARVAATKQLLHISDLHEDPAYKQHDPDVIAFAERAGARTFLAVPMLREEALIGTISIYRQEVRPFTKKQIALVQNFANQAVVAIENTRLLNELRQRTGDLSEALEQQTATSEVLKVISQSSGALEPVFNAVLANATRICEAAFGSMLLRDGDALRRVALYNAPPKFTEFNRKSPLVRPEKIRDLK
jgi:GAF domain-containing protein